MIDAFNINNFIVNESIMAQTFREVLKNNINKTPSEISKEIDELYIKKGNEVFPEVFSEEILKNNILEIQKNIK